MPVPVVAGLSLTPIAKPIAAILAAIYGVVPNYGVAILVLSLGWMILIAPLTLKTTRSMLAMQRLNPQLTKLKEKYANDRQALSQATMDLYKENNVSPFGSCLPTLLPLPIFFALFRVIDGLSNVTKGHATPKYLAHNTQMYRDIVAAGGHLNAFGLDLSKNILSSHSGIATTAPYVLVLLIMMATQYWQTVSMMNRNPANADNPQAKMMKYLPLIFGVVCIRFPAGVIVYYAMSNICRVTQQSLMYRFDPKVKSLANKDAAFIDAEVKDIEAGRRPRETPAMPAPRSKFRDLLSNGVEQQAAARTTSNGTRNGNGNGNGNGAKKLQPTNGTSTTGNTTNGNTTNGNTTNGKAKPKPTPTPALAGTKAAASTKGSGGGRTGAGSSNRSKKKR